MRNKAVTAGLAALCCLLSATAIVGAVTQGWSFSKAVDGFVVSNCIIGLSFGLCGAVLAWHRPRNPIGWMYAIGGTLMTATAASSPMAEVLRDAGAPTWLVRLDISVFQWAWPWHIGLVLPLSLLLFPDGHLPGRRWRPVAWLMGLTAPLFVIEIGTAPAKLGGLPDGYGVLSFHDELAPLWTVSELRWSLSMLIALSALAVRYRRGDEQLRR
jgi:two-component system NarL family sensor kinase